MTTREEFIAFCNTELQKHKARKTQEQQLHDEQLRRDFYAKFGIHPEKVGNNVVYVGEYQFKHEPMPYSDNYVWYMYLECPRCSNANKLDMVRSAAEIAAWFDVDPCSCRKLGPFIWKEKNK